jgi:hypothetical protein
MFFEYAHESGFLSDGEYELHTDKLCQALSDVSMAQRQYQQNSDPTVQFFALLGSALATGQAHVMDRNGSMPSTDPLSWGWRRYPDEPKHRYSPQGLRIGWLDKDDLYLDPTASFQVVQKIGRELGDVVAVGRTTLWKRLHDAGLLASNERKNRDTYTIRRVIQGASIPVIHVQSSTVFGSVGMPPDPVEDVSEIGDLSDIACV